ncbi:MULTISPECIES: TetR/AcrR family transcriptional regulator [unclassified Variovorax]|uniref:TetR/AcrR family transcriptional regulator n=1 Tax=unclassified Variovorax TaxID=663243 RepID=UPI000BE4532C|nr:TetR/AcrR family transcriptional regulator [Variovorax sp. YR752]
MSKQSTEDHRVRVGAQRRGKTRLRLLQSAFAVVARKGPEATVIDDVISEAGVARGTFYNHFGTTGELLLALAVQLSDEALAFIDPAVLELLDPVERFSTGTRLYMQTALRYPTWGRFITSVGTRIAARGQLIDRNLTRDVSDAIARRRLTVPNAQVARDIVLGSIFYGIETMLTESTHDNHADELVATFLRGMGIDAQEADQIAYMALPEIGPIAGPVFSTLPPPVRRVARRTKKTAAPEKSALKAQTAL